MDLTAPIRTERLTLRPLRRADRAALREIIFSDPEVAKGLAHDISTPELREAHARGWCEELAADAPGSGWASAGIGGWAVEDRTGTLAAPETLMGVAGVFGAAREGERRSGELFYALGRAHHGQGVMTEAAAAVLAAWDSLPGAGRLYATYWAVLNPASGRILRGLGFEEAGPHPLLAEYGAERARSFAAFELWRLREAAAADRARVLEEAGIKLGHLAAEGLVGRERAAADLLAALPEAEREALAAAAEEAVARGAAGYGMTLLLRERG